MDGIRLIDVGALFDQIRLQANRSSLGETRTPEIGGLEIISQIKEAPTIDAELVRHGRWEEIRNAYGELEGWLCKCGCEVKSKDKYCPNCGAKMDQAED